MKSAIAHNCLLFLTCACSEPDAILFGCGSDTTIQKHIQYYLAKSVIAHNYLLFLTCACSELDAMLFGCNSDPTMQKQIHESLVESVIVHNYWFFLTCACSEADAILFGCGSCTKLRRARRSAPSCPRAVSAEHIVHFQHWCIRPSTWIIHPLRVRCTFDAFRCYGVRVEAILVRYRRRRCRRSWKGIVWHIHDARSTLHCGRHHSVHLHFLQKPYETYISTYKKPDSHGPIHP